MFPQNRAKSKASALLDEWTAVFQVLDIKLNFIPSSTLCKMKPAVVFEKITADRSLYLDNLSRRELLVFEFLKNGKTSEEIAAILTISQRTVEKHVQNIYKKLEVRCRAELLRKSA